MKTIVDFRTLVNTKHEASEEKKCAQEFVNEGTRCSEVKEARCGRAIYERINRRSNHN